jgi:ankyrin repeat protein
MIFLASYKFSEPVGDEFRGDFVINDASPYIDNVVLNPSAMRRNKKSQKMPDAVSPIPFKALYEFYTKRLSGSTIEGLSKSRLPLLMGGSSQYGGGPEDDLVRAIETNDITKIKAQVKQDASLINKTDANGNTMLMIACKSKNLGIVKTLLEMGAQGTINKQNAVGDTALHIACKNGYATIASVLVLNGADLTIKNVLGKTPIEVCTDPALKAKLELHMANVKKMFEFVKNNRTQDLRQLLETFRGVNLVDLTTGDTPLHIACQLGNQDIALLLIQAGANPTLKNNNGKTPFDLVENETLKANLQDQYSLTQTLFEAVENDSLPEIEHILDRLPKNQVSILVNSRTNPESAEQGETPLHIAVKTGNKEITKFLLDKGADVNIGDKYEATPLHFACRNGDGYIARMLVEFGGDLTIKAIDGRTPLDACKTNELRIDLIKDYIEKLARDKKLNLPKGSGLSRANDEASIKKALAYYLKKPNKIESKNSYYVVMDLDLYPGKSISTAQKARMQCSRVWDNIQEAWADSRGADYVPKEQNISKAPLPVPVAEARPIRRERTRRRYGGKKSGSTRRCLNKKCRGPKTRKHKRMKHKSNSRRVKK